MRDPYCHNGSGDDLAGTVGNRAGFRPSSKSVCRAKNATLTTGRLKGVDDVSGRGEQLFVGREKEERVGWDVTVWRKVTTVVLDIDDQGC